MKQIFMFSSFWRKVTVKKSKEKERTELRANLDSSFEFDQNVWDWSNNLIECFWIKRTSKIILAYIKHI